MANAKQCDRCLEFYTERPANPIENIARAMAEFAESISPHICKTKEQQAIEMVLDLCPECSKSLTRWLHGKGGGEDGNQTNR